MRRSILTLIAVAAIMTIPAAAGAQEIPTPTCNGTPATLWGTTGDDTLIGTARDDVIVGGDGNDHIQGLGGNDIICGGDGDDEILGRSGDDTINGGPGNDNLNGGDGDDRILGRAGDDLISGGPGADTLHGGTGSDRVLGDGGDDSIDGGPGDDNLSGGSGNDRIFGRSGDDLISGRAGSDVLEGGSGSDRVLGHDGNDRLFGGNQDDVIDGGGGRDLAMGNGGVDVCSSEETRVCELEPLSRGDRGSSVQFLQRALRHRELYRGEIDGIFDREVAIAVATFHKAIGPAYSNPNTAVARWQANPPSERMTISDWGRLLAFRPEPPKSRPQQPDRVEIDIGRQLLYLILDHEVDAIVHISTGYNPRATPRTTGLPSGGYFWYKHPYNGWSPRPGAWSIYKFWAYKAGSDYNYGVHGYPNVPYWPASHGCTRVEVWEADYLHKLFAIRMPVHVWDK